MRAKNKVPPLVAQGLAGNVVALCNSVADVLSRRWHVERKLHRDARHELASMANVAAAAREVEARCKTLLVMVPARHCPCDGRLARAC